MGYRFNSIPLRVWYIGLISTINPTVRLAAKGMASVTGESTGPLEIQQKMDACCQAFEQAWKKGDAPKLEEFVTGARNDGRTDLLRELLILEMNYRRDDRGASLTDSQLCALHPGMSSEIAEQLKLLRDGRAGDIDDAAETRIVPAEVKDADPTIDHAPRSDREPLSTGSRGSRGLHIRCPHCSNPVELLTDTPFESITCRTCGSAFSLVDQEDHTREAPTLKTIGRFELVARIGMVGLARFGRRAIRSWTEPSR